MTVVILAGYPASGKSTAASMMEDAGWPVVSMGGTLRDTVDSDDEEDVWAYAEELRETHGEHGVAIPCAYAIEDHLQGSDLVVLEGSRNPAETAYLQRELGAETHVAWVEADFEDRVEWFAAREGRGGSRQELLERTQREVNAGMDGYLSEADVTLVNSGNKRDLQDEVTNLLSEITQGE